MNTVEDVAREVLRLSEEALDFEEELRLAYIAGASIEDIAKRRLALLQDRIYGPGNGSVETGARTSSSDVAARVPDVEGQSATPGVIP